MVLGSESVAVFAPETIRPLCRQTKVSGPVPSAAVLNSAASPAQRTRLLSTVAVVLVSTVTSAKFVALPQGPVTSTA